MRCFEDISLKEKHTLWDVYITVYVPPRANELLSCRPFRGSPPVSAHVIQTTRFFFDFLPHLYLKANLERVPLLCLTGGSLNIDLNSKVNDNEKAQALFITVGIIHNVSCLRSTAEQNFFLKKRMKCKETEECVFCFVASTEFFFFFQYIMKQGQGVE